MRTIQTMKKGIDDALVVKNFNANNLHIASGFQATVTPSQSVARSLLRFFLLFQVK